MKKILTRALPVWALIVVMLISTSMPVSAKTANASATPTVSGASYKTTVKIHLSDIPDDGTVLAKESATFPSGYVSLSSYDYLRVKFTPQKGAEVVSVVATITKSGVATEVTLPLYDTDSKGVRTYRSKSKIDGTITQIDINLKHVCEYDYKQIPATTTKATCTEDGTLTRTCIYCNGTDTQINEKATGHTFTKKLVDEKYLLSEATCIDDAVYYYSCCVCGEIGTETFVDQGSATGHTWDDGVITKEATEEETGVKTFTCKTCNATYTEEIPVLEHTHSFTQNVAEDKYLVKEATCTSAAVYHTSCKCGEAGTETFEYGDPIPHSFTDYVSDHNATCTEDGTKTAVCDLCGEAKKTVKDAGSATGHDWDEGVITKEATEEETGIRTYTCKTCNATYTEEIPVLEHTHSFTQNVAEEQYLVKTATCTSAAVYHTSCVCGAAGTETFEYGDPLQHSFTSYVSDHNATCIEDGTKTAICDLCGEAKDTINDEGSATGHVWDSGEIATPATCTEEGVKTYTCTKDASHTKTEEIPALGHDLVEHEAKAPTCTENGWEAYETCSRCDYTTYKELPALEHDLVQHEAKAPTCTESGWEAYETCSRCDYTTYKEIPALEHDLVQHEAKAPTCTESGWEAYETCTRCDYTTYKELPALSHDLEYRAAKEATTDAEGNTAHWYCKVCGKFFSDKEGTKEIAKADTVIARLKDDVKAPQTGDTSNLALWVVLLLISSCAAIGATVAAGKKRTTEN